MRTSREVSTSFAINRPNGQPVSLIHAGQIFDKLSYVSMLLRSILLTLCGVVFATAQDLASQAVGVLQAHCASCHAGGVAMSGFRVDSREALLRGGQRGVAVKPNDSSNSLL